MLSALILAIILTIIMATAMLWDVASFRIPNWLNGGLLLFYPVAYFLFDHQMDWLMALAGFGAVFALGYVIFAFKVMGGGDVKLFAVCGLWIGWGQPLLEFVLFACLLGGPLTLILMGARLVSAYVMGRYTDGSRDIPRVLSYGEPMPYGLAIGGAFMIMLWLQLFPMIYHG